jgi:hypothetical protein
MAQKLDFQGRGVGLVHFTGWGSIIEACIFGGLGRAAVFFWGADVRLGPWL